MSTSPQSGKNAPVRPEPLSTLFPPAVVVSERRRPGDPADLLPGEAQYVSRARLKRLQEFAAGRACARMALAEFGVRDFALHVAEDRQPLWPQGFVGSITHTAGLCAAAVASRTQILAIGIDSEVVGAPTNEVWSTICGAEELAWVDSLPTAERAAAVTLLFSAKEAVYKCQYPLTGEWLDFHDLAVAVPDWRAASPSFIVRATRSIGFGRYAALPITGRHVFHEGFVSAGVFLCAPQ